MKGVWGQRATQCSDFASGLLSYSCGYRTYLRNTLVRSFKAAIRGTGPKVSYCGPETFLAGERQRQRLCDLSRPKPPSHQATKLPSHQALIPNHPKHRKHWACPPGPPRAPPFRAGPSVLNDKCAGACSKPEGNNERLHSFRSIPEGNKKQERLPTSTPKVPAVFSGCGSDFGIDSQQHNQAGLWLWI